MCNLLWLPGVVARNLLELPSHWPQEPLSCLGHASSLLRSVSDLHPNVSIPLPIAVRFESDHEMCKAKEWLTVTLDCLFMRCCTVWRRTLACVALVSKPNSVATTFQWRWNVKVEQVGPITTRSQIRTSCSANSSAEIRAWSAWSCWAFSICFSSSALASVRLCAWASVSKSFCLIRA